MYQLVSIHVPLAEHDLRIALKMRLRRGFNSRAPRGARHYQRTQTYATQLVSIHVPLAEHDLDWLLKQLGEEVSIHVPLAEHDGSVPRSTRAGYRFQFTCPSRSTTYITNI